MNKSFKWILWFIGTMIMAWLGNYFYDSTKDIPVIKYPTGALNWLWIKSLMILNYPIKFWIVIVSAIGLYLIYQAIKAAKEPKESPKPDWLNYKKDVFKKWIWRWDWKPTTEGWVVKNLIAYCPNDDIRLISRGNYTLNDLYCPGCGTNYDGYNNPVELPSETVALIEAKIVTNKYPKE